MQLLVEDRRPDQNNILTFIHELFAPGYLPRFWAVLFRFRRQKKAPRQQGAL